MDLLNSTSFQRMETGLQAANLRQNVISNNIANEETPYFKRSEVSFENLLQQEMNGNTPQLRGKVTNPRHFVIGPMSSIPEPVVTVDQSTAMNNNLNNVDVDSEMANLAANQIQYNSYIQQMNEQIKMMRVAVEGR
ncbi:flagellar basal body rod protein FlgB [Paenibacillus sp. J23TS9]|uniref:Flagellar basal body rod protein FlgB n=1 Tax=Paenibacillus dokdonensis TaxID=2567944 RepID=A0ABU6GM81_9BACL|nr:MULTISPECIES: flagellar basal body rod protein FlgB [Paenibacillus]MEC0240538.1 flagellar basal body rod protein FlgB [Paenibacillus dokdonensis]GIP27388.1 flagellar basal body rod protein FlgB [Paenibacillus sp. J23TS9]